MAKPCHSLDGKRVGAIYQAVSEGKPLYFISQCARDARVFEYAGETYLTLTQGERNELWLKLRFDKFNFHRRDMARLAVFRTKAWELVLSDEENCDKIAVLRLKTK